MPELPEVETVKEKLKKRLVGRIISNAIIHYDGVVQFPSKDIFISEIKNETIVDIKRRGKWLMFELKKHYLLVHLRMEGKFFFKSTKETYNKHEHVIFLLDDNEELRYHDTRKFGKMHLIEKSKIGESEHLNKLGLEPFDEELNVSYLRDKLSGKRIPIKLALLDQCIITGIGNIYVDEILFKSSINPNKPSSGITNGDLEKIISNSKDVLNKAIILGGTTIRSYTSIDDTKGQYQNKLLVHGKKGEPCSICGTSIEKIKVGGRGTYFCPKCQIEE